MMVFGVFSYASILSLFFPCSCMAAAVVAGEFSTAGRCRHLPPCETPALYPRAALNGAHEEQFVLPWCLIRVLNIFSGTELELQHKWPCKFLQLCGQTILTPASVFLTPFFFLGATCLSQTQMILTMDFYEKRAASRTVTKRISSSQCRYTN